MKIKKYFVFLCLFTAVAVGLNAQLIDKPAASINLSKPEMISVKQLEAQVQALLILQQRSGQSVQAMDKSSKLEVLDMMISNTLIMQGAEEKGIKADETEILTAIANQKAQLEQQNQRTISDQQFREAVEKQGYSWAKYREQISRQIVQQKFIAVEKQSELQSYMKMPTFDEIETFYRQNKTKFSNPEMVRYSQIFISTLNKSGSQISDAERKAEEAYLKYEKGTASFEKLVSDYSDDQAAKYRNGDSGYISYNDQTATAYLGRVFMSELFSLSNGEVSGVIKSNVGYHIVKITDVREAKLLTLDDQIHPSVQQTVREYIAQQLISRSQNEALSKVLNELVAELRKNADIKIFEENID